MIGAFFSFANIFGIKSPINKIPNDRVSERFRGTQMKQKAQASLEYVFMIAAALVVVFIVVKVFIGPRIRTIYHIGQTMNSTVKNIKNIANSSIDE